MGHVIRARGRAVALVTPQERSVSKVRHLLLGLSLVVLWSCTEPEVTQIEPYNAYAFDVFTVNGSCTMATGLAIDSTSNAAAIDEAVGACVSYSSQFGVPPSGCRENWDTFETRCGVFMLGENSIGCAGYFAGANTQDHAISRAYSVCSEGYNCTVRRTACGG